ncbi:FxsA family protein, partial [Asanoa iriomotensis]|uniref:FxsA family protein n=1 Tax=Asanoa iriomotensis TaxID=234613 RepID=UPI0031D851F7
MRRQGLVRWMPLAILLTAAVEIAVFILVAHLIGFGFTVLLVLAASAAGVLLLRREGMRAWRGFRAAADAGQPPGNQVTDGLVGLGAGLLLAIPGLVSAVLGILLALPPGRQIARLVARRATERRISSAAAGDLFGPRRVRVRRGAPRPPEGGGGGGSGRPPAGATAGAGPAGPAGKGPT